MDHVIEMEDRAHELLDCQGYLSLACIAMQKAGHAAIALGALYRMVDGKRHETFASIAKIREGCHVPRRTLQSHLKLLQESGFVENLGRLVASNGRYARRTCTLRLSPLALDHKKPYGVIPIWALDHLNYWTDQFVYSAVLSRATLIDNCEEQRGTLDERYFLTAMEVVRSTGLGLRVVRRSIARLQAAGLIQSGEYGINCKCLTLPAALYDQLFYSSRQGTFLPTLYRPQETRDKAARRG